VTKLLPFSDGFRIISRAMDHTMKIWDVRNTKTPLEAIYNLENNLPACRLALSPDEKYILTGTSVDRQNNVQGMLKLYESTGYTEAASFGTGPNGVTDIKWHPGLNQIFVGTLIFNSYYLIPNLFNP
jgi:WD40 repeat protein